MFPRPSRASRDREKRERRRKRIAYERDNKAAVRRRDRGCRFPLCGCSELRLRDEVAHLEHKQMGGDPGLHRSGAPGMIRLCYHRHRLGRVSLHAGTLRVVALTMAGTDGPVAFQVDRDFVPEQWFGPGGYVEPWVELARETAPGILAPLTEAQRAYLEQLAHMEL